MLWLVEACFISVESKAQQMLFCLCALRSLGFCVWIFGIFVQLFLLSLSV